MKKQIASLILAFVMMGSVPQISMAAPDNNAELVSEDGDYFTDIKNHWANTEINSLASEKIVSGFGETFLPDDKITKAEFASMICALTGTDAGGGVGFKDVSKSDWFYDYVKTIINRGYAEAAGDMFNPGGEVTLKDAVSILYRLCENGKNDNTVTYGDEVFYSLNITSPLSAWERQAFAYCSKKGMLYKFYGVFSYDVQKGITRGEAAVLIYRLKNHLGITAKVNDEA